MKKNEDEEEKMEEQDAVEDGEVCLQEPCN